MKLLTILQAFALLMLAVFGATAGGHSSGGCPGPGGPSITCDLSQPSGSGSGGNDLR